MKMKKTLALILTAMLAASAFTACGEKPSSPDAEGGNGSSSEQEAYTVKILIPGDAKTDDCKEVSEAASKITKEKFNTTLDITRVGFGTYKQEVNLMLASSEKLDMMYSYCGDVTSAVSNGQIVALDEYLDGYGKDLKEQIGQSDWDCVSTDGSIYGVPSNKEKATGWGFVMSKEMADATGVDYSTINKPEELEPLLTAAKEMFPNSYPVVPHNGTVSIGTDNDDLGGDFGSLETSSSDSTTVINWYETDTFKKNVDLAYDWAQKGLIMPDASTNTENGDSLIGSGKGFGRFINTKPGIDQEVQKNANKEVAVIELVAPYTTTTRVDIVWYVPHNSEKPERAVQILNEAYINADLSNTLINGVEGKHYEVVDAEKGIVNYPDGVDGTSTGYTSLPWAWPNEMISYVWEGNSETIWKDTDEFNKTAIVSPGKGFSWDNTMVQNEVTACANVRSKYVAALEAGSLNPETTMPKFLKELKDAGVDTIIKEKQNQFDKWLAEQK